MSSIATARAGFLEKVEAFASGQASRFAPALDDLIRWSDANGLTFLQRAGANDQVRFCLPDSTLPFWTATPRSGDGAKFTMLNSLHFPEPLRLAAREELGRIDGKAALPDGIPVVAFTNLIWEPYRTRVLDLMSRLLVELKRSESDSTSLLEAGS